MKILIFIMQLLLFAQFHKHLKMSLLYRGVQAEKLLVNPNGVEGNFYGSTIHATKEALRLQYSFKIS